MGPEQPGDGRRLDWRAIGVGIVVTVLVVLIGDLLVSDAAWLLWVVGGAIGGFVAVRLSGRRTRSNSDASAP
jgi:cyanate permease